MRKICLCLLSVLLLLSVISCDGADDGFDGGRPMSGEDLKELYESLQREQETQETEEESLPEVVYWFDGGSVWHADPDCGYLKNHEELLSGTPDEALACGIERGCSRCGKSKN